jgi:hypothetical protein
MSNRLHKNKKLEKCSIIDHKVEKRCAIMAPTSTVIGLATIKLGRYHGSKCGPTLLSNLAPPPLYMAFHYECSPKFHALLKEEGRSNKSTH